VAALVRQRGQDLVAAVADRVRVGGGDGGDRLAHLDDRGRDDEDVAEKLLGDLRGVVEVGQTRLAANEALHGQQSRLSMIRWTRLPLHPSIYRVVGG